MMKSLLIYSLVLALLSMPLAGCGIKPDSVDPPPGAENIVFPRTYPESE